MVQDWGKWDLGFRFGSLKLKFDMLVEWNGLIDNVVENALFVWGYCCNSLQEFGKCDLGLRFGSLKLKFHM